MLKKILFLLLIFFKINSFAQEIYHLNFGRKDGLPTTTIYNSLSAKDGSLWFATDMGILKYDGYSFIEYNSQNGLADDENFNLFQDSKGRIWFYSYNGKISFYANDRFYNESNLPFLKTTDNLGYISSIIENKNESFDIIYSKGKLLNLDLKKKKITNNVFDKISYKFIQNNNSYFITSNEIKNSTQKKINNLGISNFSMFSIPRYCSWNNKLFLSQGTSVYIIENLKCRKIIDLKLNSNEIIYLFIDSKNKFWIGTRLGVYIYDILDLNKKPEYHFSKNAISSINEDFEGKIWLTTLDNGIYYLPNTKINIIKNKEEELMISALYKNSGNIIAGTDLDKYYTFQSLSKISEHKLNVFQAKNKISQITNYRNTTYIVGKHGIRMSFQNNNIDIPFIGSKCLYFENDTVWIGATYLLKTAVKDLIKLTNTGLLSSDSRVLLTEKTNCIISINNTKWIGTNKGLYIYYKGKFEELSIKYPALKTIISDIYHFQNGNITIVSTLNKGLFVFKNNTLIKHYSTNNGLLSNSIFRLKKHNSTTVFVCTNNGLNSIVISKDTINIFNLNKYIGIENFKINDIQFFDNHLLLATENGLLSIPKVLNFFKPIKPKINIDLFEVNNFKRDPFKNHQLTYKENNIKIGFSGISFQTQKKIKYLYRLKGIDENWQSTTAREIIYNSVSPGQYIFEIKALNGSDVSSNLISIPISISKPFWKTFGFIFFILLFFGVITFLIWKKRIENINKKFEMERIQIQTERDKANLEKQMIELEQKALRMQMNPHFIFNALNTIKGYYSEGNDEKASDYISKFSMLLRLLLENSEQLISLTTEIKMLELYIELTQIRYKNVFDYKIEVDTKLNPEDTAIPPLLLQPIVENAIIHGLAPKPNKGILHVSFILKNNMLICIVDDNGIGLNASKEKQQIKQHQSKAITITKERVSLLDDTENKSNFSIQEKFDSQKNSLGTIVEIQIPFKNIW